MPSLALIKMSIIKLLLYPFVIIVGALGVFAYKNVIRIFSKYRHYKNEQVPQSWQAIFRNDFNKWDQKSIMRGCFIRFPSRFLAVLFFFVGAGILILISQISDKISRQLLELFRKYIAKPLFRTMIELKQQQDEKQINTPIIISNHVCWLDILYLCTQKFPISFVAKQGMSRVFFIGRLMKIIQCLFVFREDSQARNDILSQIKRRVDKFEKQSGQTEVYNSVAIFPEGTTSNGKSILRFKIGAFASKPRITIYGLIYECNGFDMGMDQVTPIEHFILSLSLKARLKTKRIQIEPRQVESPQQYMVRCQQTMGNLTGFKIYDSGFREKCALLQMRNNCKQQ